MQGTISETRQIPVKDKFDLIICGAGVAGIAGEDTFNGEERHYDTSIGMVGDFRRPGRHFEFPLGMIYNGNFPNILAAGRIASADGDGWEISRVIPSAALTGQASGIAASLMVKHMKKASELNIGEVQKILEKNNISLHF